MGPDCSPWGPRRRRRRPPRRRAPFRRWPSPPAEWREAREREEEEQEEDSERRPPGGDGRRRPPPPGAGDRARSAGANSLRQGEWRGGDDADSEADKERSTSLRWTPPTSPGSSPGGRVGVPGSGGLFREPLPFPPSILRGRRGARGSGSNDGGHRGRPACLVVRGGEWVWVPCNPNVEGGPNVRDRPPCRGHPRGSAGADGSDGVARSPWGT